jgi:S-adenosylmethionine-diacylglycerol 3-amino-3-carboxypropyl transferase
MRAPYGFGLSQEDERTEATALGLPGGSVLSIASAGDMPLSLLALGADEVVAVDIDVNQLHLTELKRAAVLSLSREDAIRFLGFLPATTAERRRWLAVVSAHLPPDANAFWHVWSGDALRGAIAAGRYERYIGMDRALARPLAGRAFRQLVECATLDEQQAVFARSFDRPMLRALFTLVFHPRLYGWRGLDPRALQHLAPQTSLGRSFFERFRALCCDSPARENPFLQWHLLGRVRTADVVPEYLTEWGARVARERSAALSCVQGSIEDYLEASPGGRFDRFHLSNVSDWLSAPEFDRLLHLMVEKARKPARVVWRYLHRRPLVPENLQTALRTDPRLATELQRGDRFPVYSIVPADIRA